MLGDMMPKQFTDRLRELGLSPNNDQLDKLEQYYEYLHSENLVMNLTAITGKEEVYHKHFLDSLSLVKAFDPNDKSILDIGSGAGFPSSPLKIFFPSMRVTIIEATTKKIAFLTRLLEHLDIKGVVLENIRAEAYQARERFDIVTARAVAKLNILSEIAIPFVKKKGLMIAMKSGNFKEELQEALNAIKILGGTLKEVIDYPIDDDTVRSLIVIEKLHKTPMLYPRAYPKIKKKPL